MNCLPPFKSIQQRFGDTREIGLVVAVFCTGLVMFFKWGAAPGDLGDARFNMYVLEHGYRWLLGLDPSFWSAPFFYPAQNVIAYSDNHLGSFLSYALFRILGVSRETAFQLWAITIFSLNYFVTYVVVRRQKFNPIGAIACAYLFTFSMIMAAQMSHIQLAPRFMVPVAFWMTTRFVETGKAEHLLGLLAACACQVYLGIYISYFLFLSLVPFLVLTILVRKQWNEIGSFFIRAGVWALFRRGLEYAVCGLAFVVVLLPLAIPYYKAQQEIGARNWEQVVPMLPRWQSYLYAPTSFLWEHILRFGDELPMANEHALFFGLLPWVAILAFAYLRWNNRREFAGSEVGIAMMGVLLYLGILTFYFRGFSLYRLAWGLPGAGGIRAVTRMVFILLYPLAFISGVIVTFLISRLEAAYGRWRSWFLGIGLLAMVSYDQGSKVSSINESKCQERIAYLKARIDNPGHKVLWVSYRSDEPSFVQQIDAMLAGQDLGLNVVNGYSGLAPKNYPFSLYALTDDQCNGISVWARLHPESISKDCLLQVGPHCQIPGDDFLPTPMGGFTALEEKNSVQALATDRCAELAIPRIPGVKIPQILSFDLSTVKVSRSIKISDPDGQTKYIDLAPGRNEHVEIVLSPQNSEKILKFQTDQEGEKAGHGDKRRWFYFISNMHLKQAEQR
ncbi:MAG: hypothetical protein JO334_16000 [Verrucomicrobia bacterium]|nr:hypothetical protein [Verrucomicrobiota bacterium]